MKRVYIRKNAKMYEEDGAVDTATADAITQDAAAAPTGETSKSTTGKEDSKESKKAADKATQDENKRKATLAQLQIRVHQRRQQFDTDCLNLKKQYDKDILVLIQQAEALGGTLIVKESVQEKPNSSLLSIGELRFGKKLFESRKPESLVFELIKLLYSALQNANVSYAPISYEMAQKELKSRAREIKTFLYNRTTNDWNSEIVPKNHWDEVAAFIKDRFKNGNKSEFHYTDSEFERIMNKLEERFRKSEHFSWIFGNELNKK